MKAFDRRHKWGMPSQEGARISRTCRVCGRTDVMEMIVPNAFVMGVIDVLRQRNPYRAVVR